MGIDGKWRATGRQAADGKSPVKPILPGQYPDLVIEGGAGYAVRRLLAFPLKREGLFYQQDEDGSYGIRLTVSYTEITAIPQPDGTLATRWYPLGKDESGEIVYYKRA